MTDIKITGFEMMHKLGEGGMATVWQARQVSLDRIVAIKILSSKFASDGDDIQRFQQEAQSAAKLKHPGIVQVYDANIENGVYFIVMEFVDGYTCADWLLRRGKLEEKDVLLIAECVSDALGYAWERQSIIHCDIKPDNVMVDEDGTVKVTDLGLSRTINSMNVDEETDIILGTPAYMAPEQAMGEAGQDCRLDMYALGAMMYHLSTGRLLFEGAPESEVMERQVNDTVENPRDLNPLLSRGFCRLVEVLMTKDKAGRPADWGLVKDAIKKVKKGHIPRLSLAEGMQSTVLKSEAEEAHAHAAKSRPASADGETGAPSPGNKKLIGMIAGGAVALLLVVVVLSKLMGGSPPASNGGAVTNGGGAAPVGLGQGSLVEQKGRTLYGAASKYEKTNPASYTQSISRYLRVVSEAPGTPFEERAGKDVARLKKARMEDAKISAMMSIDRKAASLLRMHSFDDAIRLYADYSGPVKESTQSARDAKISEIGEKKRLWLDAEAKRVVADREANYEKLLDSLVTMILQADFRSGKLAVERASIQGSFPGHKDELKLLVSSLNGANSMDQRILESFAKQKDSKVTVRLASGSKTLVIEGVKDGVITGSESLRVGAASATLARAFRVADLAVAERLGRMGRDGDPAVALVKGVMAYRSQSFSHARRYFGSAPQSISQKLLAAMESGAIVSPVTVEVPDVPRVAVAPIRVPVAAPPPLAAPKAPAAQADDVDAFIGKLLASNEGMDSEQVSIKTGASGEVVSVSVSRAPLGDLSAFAALRSLKDFRYNGHWRDAAPVSDLTPLAGLPLESLVMSNTKVGSVEPIRGMKLKRLALTKCPLKDIKPLQAMKLESLDLSGTKVFDFSHAKSMPLKSFAANGTSLKNVTFLRGMKLESLSIADTPVYDFSVFARMPIKALNVSETQFKHLTQIKDCPLESLRANGSKISDLSGLKSFASTLTTLELNNIIAKKFEVLKTLDLTRLSLAGTQFRDSSILSDMELEYLNLDQTKVASIDAVNLEKMVHLSIQKTEVSSIAKLKGSQLVRFYCRGASVRDFSPIYGAPIVYMTLDGPERKTALYRKLPKLVNVNGQNIHGRPVWR